MYRDAVCRKCGESFVSHALRGPAPKWCARCKSIVLLEQSRIKSRAKSDAGYLRQCQGCGDTWKARSPRAKFCSDRCQYIFYGTRKSLPCSQCGAQFDCTATAAAAGRQFCSKGCMLAARRRPAKPCLECGVMFTPKIPKDPRKGKGLYCSKRCAGAARRAGKREGRWREAHELRACRAKVKPSQRMYAAMQDAMRRQMESIASLWQTLLGQQWCEVCGRSCRQDQRCCSHKCASKITHNRRCKHCRRTVVSTGFLPKRVCRECKRKLRKKYKRVHSKGIRERALRYGVLREPYSRVELLQRDHWTCQLCNAQLLGKWTYNSRTLVPHPRNATLDHIMPMSRGGADAAWNIQACCLQCNGRKSAAAMGQLRLRLQ